MVNIVFASGWTRASQFHLKIHAIILCAFGEQWNCAVRYKNQHFAIKRLFEMALIHYSSNVLHAKLTLKEYARSSNGLLVHSHNNNEKFELNFNSMASKAVCWNLWEWAKADEFVFLMKAHLFEMKWCDINAEWMEGKMKISVETTQSKYSFQSTQIHSTEANILQEASGSEASFI